MKTISAEIIFFIVVVPENISVKPLSPNCLGRLCQLSIAAVCNELSF